MKRPAFMFYPADWRKDAALQSCSIAARGLWHELLCVMHECVPYGHLCINGVAINEQQAARLCGVRLNDYGKLMIELWGAGVPSVDDAGILFSRRMVKDERIRTVRAEAGKQGGNPLLLGGKVKQKEDVPPDLLNQASNLDLTPSFAVAVALSSSVNQPTSTSGPHKPNGSAGRATRLAKDWRLPDPWKQWAVDAHHLEPERVVRISLSFRDYWIAKPSNATRLDWQATWRNWVRKEVGDA